MLPYEKNRLDGLMLLNLHSRRYREQQLRKQYCKRRSHSSLFSALGNFRRYL